MYHHRELLVHVVTIFVVTVTPTSAPPLIFTTIPTSNLKCTHIIKNYVHPPPTPAAHFFSADLSHTKSCGTASTTLVPLKKWITIILHRYMQHATQGHVYSKLPYYHHCHCVASTACFTHNQSSYRHRCSVCRAPTTDASIHMSAIT